MRLMKKGVALWLALVLALSLTACGGGSGEDEGDSTGDSQVEDTTQDNQGEDSTVTEEEAYSVRVAALQGPTGMGLVKLMSDSDSGEEGATAGQYTFTLAASATEVTPSLVKGDLDVACVPANMAAVLYNQTEGDIVALNVNTLGVLYIVENGETISSIEDLRGKTIVASGKDATPEYSLRYLLEQNGIDPDNDVSIDWKNEHSECVAALASGAATIALLPQPFVTVAQTKIEGLRVALDLTEEWDALALDSALLTGVTVARKDFVEEHPAAVEAFLQDYAASVEWVNANVADAAQLIADYGIVEAAAVAEKALPYCNIVCITGSEMKDKLSGYLGTLETQAPDAIGGSLPGDDFYYGA